jgi:hypothetical protein
VQHQSQVHCDLCIQEENRARTRDALVIRRAGQNLLAYKLQDVCALQLGVDEEVHARGQAGARVR